MTVPEPGNGPARPLRLWGMRPWVAVVAAALLMGIPTLRGGFVGGDDHRLVLNHALVNHPSLDHAVKLFKIVHRDLYQPIPLLSFSLEFAVAETLGLFDEGVAGGAWLFHLTNTILHAINSLLLWIVIRNLDGRDDSASRDAVAAIAAILFAIHPIQMEVVAWVNGRMMLLSTLFALASIVAVNRWLSDVRPRWALLTVLCVLLCAVSKIRVALPLLLIIALLSRRKPLSRGFVVVWAACLAVTGVFVYVNYLATAGAGMFEGAAENLHGPRVARALLALAWYFQHFVWPAGLASWYPTPGLVRWSDAAVIRAIVTVLAGLAIVFWSSLRSRTVALGFFWFFASIASTVQLVPTRNALAADRYMYLPIVGLLWVAGIAVVNLNRRAVRWIGPPRARKAGAIAGCAFLIVLLCNSWWTGWFYETPTKKALRIAELHPTTAHVWERVAWASHNDGRFEESIEYARRELDRDDVKAQCAAFQVIGMSQLRLGQTDDALASLQRAIEVDPDSSTAKHRLASAFEELGRIDDALPLLERAVAEAPLKNPWIIQLASIVRARGRSDEARKLYAQALVNNPYEVPATLGLAELDIEIGQPESLRAAEKGLRGLLTWMPENTKARVGLGVVHHALGNVRAAVEQYRQVLRMEPSNASAALNLAQVYAAAGDVAAARPLFDLAASGANVSIEQAAAIHDFLVTQEDLQRAIALWSDFLGRNSESAEARAFLTWTYALTGNTAAAEREFDTLEAEEAAQRGIPLVLAARAYLALAGRDYDAATESAAALAASGPRGTDARGRLLRALGQVVQQRPGEPWTFCIAARLWLADGRLDAAGEFITLCEQLCPDQRCRKEVQTLRESLSAAESTPGAP